MPKSSGCSDTERGSPGLLHVANRRYFGAAKQLPGVRELFEVEPPRQVRRTRHQLYQHINGDYYGFRDEEDGVLEKVEAAAERAVRQKVSNSLSLDSSALWVHEARQNCMPRLEETPVLFGQAVSRAAGRMGIMLP